WARLGGSGCFINHDGTDTTNDCYLVEIERGGSLTPQRHLHEVMIHVLSGRGSTVIFTPDGKPQQSFEWSAGALFAIPINVPYQHFNGSGDASCRLLVVTNAPVLINLFQDSEFVFGSDYEFSDRFSGDPDYFDGSGRLSGRQWETNYVPDVRSFELQD